MGAQLQGFLYQRYVLHPAARLDAEGGRDDHLWLQNEQQAEAMKQTECAVEFDHQLISLLNT